MTQVETRYRDVPWAAIAVFHEPYMPRDPLDWEAEMRGRPVSIFVPALPDRDGCGGPWYRIASGPTRASFVCPHLAEIGD